MRPRPDWLPYLHAIRARELEIVFSACPPAAFATGLEIGGGDGFQAALLTRYVARLVSTDYYPDILENANTERVRFMVCDAETLDQKFQARQFELVFSSNVLEHVPNAGRVLRACFRVLADDGIAVHIVPTVFWKVCHVALHVPNLCFKLVERLTEKGGFAWAARQFTGTRDTSLDRSNNPKTASLSRPLWKRLVMPEPHGVSETNRAEFTAFSRARWESEFARAGFEIVSIRRGPVTSGYGFGLNWLRALLGRLGLTSEWVCVLAKPGGAPRLRQFMQMASSPHPAAPS